MDEKHSGSILVVDDNELVLETTAQFLRIAGFTVTTCSDSTKALEMLGDLEPDLLITDVCMPEITGTELAKTMRKFDVQIPIIIVTGYADVDMLIEAIRQQVFDLIKKPYDYHYLIRTAARAIAWHRQQQSQGEQTASSAQGSPDLAFLLDIGELANELRLNLERIPTSTLEQSGNQHLISARLLSLRLALAVQNRLVAAKNNGT